MHQLNELVHKFKNNLTTHPTISTLWIHFLQKKIDKYQELIIKAHQCLNNLNDTHDLSIEQIILLHSLISPQNT